MAKFPTTSRFAALAMACVLVSGCASDFGGPVAPRDYRAEDWQLVGINGTDEVVLRDGMRLRACERLGREYVKKSGWPGWGVYERIVCR